MMGITEPSTYAERVGTIMATGSPNLVFTEGQLVADRVYDYRDGDVDSINKNFPRVKTVYLVDEITLNGIGKTWCQFSAFIDFIDGTFRYFDSNAIIGVRKVNFKEAEQVTLF